MDEYIRKKMIKNFLKFINLKKSTKLECALYNFSINYAINNNVIYLLEQIYNTKADEILNLLSNNLIFIKLINDDKINYNDIIIMKPDELNPKIFEPIKLKKQLEDQIINKKEGSKMYKCKKCKKRNCEIKLKQMRSGDEPPNTIITCLECGYTINIE